MPVLWFDRPNPDLEDLLMPGQIWIRLELIHASRKIFDVSIITIIQTSSLAQPLVEMAVAGTMLPEIRNDQRQRGPILVSLLQIDGEAKRNGCRPGFTLNNLNPRSLFGLWWW